MISLPKNIYHPNKLLNQRKVHYIFLLAVVLSLSGCDLSEFNKNRFVSFPFIEVLHDKDNSLTIDEILNKQSTDFEKLDKYILLRPHTVWVKLYAPDLIKMYSQSHHLGMDDNANEIELFYYQSNKGWTSVKGGIKNYTSNNRLSTMVPSFGLTGINESYPIYLRLDAPSVGRIYLKEKTTIANTSVYRNIAYAIILGIIGFMALVNLFRGIRAKSWLIVNYALYVFSFLNIVLFDPISDVSFILFNVEPYYNYKLFYVSYIITFLFLVIYAISFLKLKQDDEKLYYIFLSLGVLFLILKTIIFIYNEYSFEQQFITIFSTTVLLLTIVFASYRALKKGKKYVGYYVLAYIILVFVGSLYTLQITFDPDFPYNSIGRNMIFAFVLEVWLLNLGLNERIVFERKQAVAEKTDAQNELIAFQSEQNIVLEEKIKERTLELEEATESIRQKSDQLQESFEKQEDLMEFKEGMVQMIAHDMKNRLNSIIGFSSSETFNKKMQRINQDGNDLLSMVTNMLDVHKFEEASISLKLTKTDVHDIIDNACKQVAMLLQMKSIRSEFKSPKNLYINVDREIMVRVLVNLLTNAIKFSRPGGEISIQAQIKEKDNDVICVIAVSDHGEGIDEEALPYIFNKFWQGKAKYSGVTASTGLGLSFCKLAVEAHEGSIEVESKKGEGSTFRVFLPVKDNVSSIEQNLESSTKEDDGFILRKDREIIEKYAEELASLEVYQVGQLNSILSKLEKENITSRWKMDLELAISTSDDERFRELLEMSRG